MNNFELNVVLSLFDQAHFVIISKAVNNPLRSRLISAHWNSVGLICNKRTEN